MASTFTWGRLGATVALSLLTVASESQPATVSAAGFEDISWQALMPQARQSEIPGLRAAGLALLGDDDPRARAAHERLKDSWGQVPVVQAMNGRRVRIKGYVVALDSNFDAQGLRELLLVPYFGARIHTPPPPPNQVIHVRTTAPIKAVKLMDAVTVSGTLRVGSSDTVQGRASYLINAELVVPESKDTHNEFDTAGLGPMTPLAGVTLSLLLAALIVGAWIGFEQRRVPRLTNKVMRMRKQRRRLQRREAARRKRTHWLKRLSRTLHLVRERQPRRSRS